MLWVLKRTVLIRRFFWAPKTHWDGSFEHPKHIFKLMGKERITILRLNFLLKPGPMIMYTGIYYREKEKQDLRTKINELEEYKKKYEEEKKENEVKNKNRILREWS